MPIYLGIDFGTSTNYIVRWDNERKEIIEEQFGEHGSSNVVSNVIYYKENEKLIGNLAEKIAGNCDNLNLVKYIKREIDKDNWTTYIPALQKHMTSKEIVTDIFREIKKKVEFNHGGEYIEGVVISVPFAFLYKERHKIKNSAIDAGINVIGLIEEPVAAAIRCLDYRQELISNKNKNILIFDLGGGTLDVTLFSCKKENQNINIEVLNTDGNKQLGGKDITDSLVEYFLNYINLDISDITDINLRNDILEKLEIEADSAKKEVSDYGDYNVYSNINDTELDFDIDDDELEKILKLKGLINEIKITIENSVYDAELGFEDLDEVVLVGGSSKLKIIKKIIQNLFNKQAIEFENPDRLVGEGAALYCGNLLNDGFKYNITHRLSQSIGIEKRGRFIEVIPKNSKYGQKSKIDWISTSKRDEVVVSIYQGNTSDIKKCSEIGKIDIDFTSYEVDQVGIELVLDKEGIIQYKIYIEDDNLNLKLIKEGELNE